MELIGCKIVVLSDVKDAALFRVDSKTELGTHFN